MGCRQMFAPVMKAHRVTVEQMAILEPVLSEKVVATCMVVIKEAIDEAVRRGIPAEAARDFILGHINIDIGILFGYGGAPFPASERFRIAREPHMMGFRIAGAPAGKGRLDIPWLLVKLDSRVQEGTRFWSFGRRLRTMRQRRLERGTLVSGKRTLLAPLSSSVMESSMQWNIIGAGNMGSVYGGNLARIGQAVAFIDVWEEHIRCIAESGLRVEGLTGKFTVAAQAFTDPAQAPKADVVLIAVNAYSTPGAAQSAHAMLKPDGFCLTIQNGIGNVETLVDTLGRNRVLAGLSFQSGDIDGPGFVRHTNNGPTYLGELDRSRSERLRLLSDLFEKAGLHPVLVDDIVATIWSKFVHNCGVNAICAITGLRPGNIQEVPELDEFQTRIIEETLALVFAKGIRLADADPIATVKEYCSHKFHRVSMAQHLDRGRQTEIDALNGFVARESKALGLAAPCNDALARLIKGREHQPVRKGGVD